MDMEENVVSAANEKKDVENEIIESEETDIETAPIDVPDKKNVEIANTSLSNENEDNLDASSNNKDEKSNDIREENNDEVGTVQNENEVSPSGENKTIAVKPTEQESSEGTKEIKKEKILQENETESIIVEDNENDRNQEIVSENTPPPELSPIVTQPSASATSEISESNEALAASSTSYSSPPKKNADASSKPNVPSPEDTVNIISSDPDRIRLKFLFANRDGLNVNVECKITDSVGEIKGVLLSMWPEGKH